MSVPYISTAMADGVLRNCGWIPFSQRTNQQIDHHAGVLKAIPRFQITGWAPDPGPRVNLLELWSHPKVVQALTYEFSGVHQITGSCVGAAMGNVQFSLATVEVLRLMQPERIYMPFWLLPYGISRMLLGMNGEGDGSTGSAMAEAVLKYGTISNDFLGLPTPSNNDGLVWGGSVETKWSNGRNIDQKYLTEAKKHVCKTVAPLRSAKAVEEAIRNLYPVTMANDRFCNPGSEQLKGTGANAAVINNPNSNGGHQTSILAVWDNPELGKLFWYQNQWGKKVYRQDPTMNRADGCWMLEETMDRACQGDGEVYAFSQHDGYPAQSLDFGVLA